MADAQTMPSVEMINWEGLFTKQNPETLKVTQLRECQNADFFREYGSLSKLRGTRRVLATQYAEGSTVKPITWGGFYKSQTLAGDIQRETLIGAGNTIQKINTDGTVTELLSGEPDGLVRTSDKLDRFMYITSQNTVSVGNRGQMSKYDGNKITQWGLTAPGDQETPIETFDDSEVFENLDSPTNATVANSTLPAYDGTATAVTKGTASATASIEDLNRTPFGINSVIADRALVSVYIPREDYSKLVTSGRAISIYVGSGGTLENDFYRYDFQIGRLIPGWNTLVMDFSTFPSGDFGTSSGTTIDDDNLASIRFEFITNNASDVVTLYWDDFVSLDQGGPSPTFGDSTSDSSVFNQAATATWKLQVTFVDEYGNESNAGPTSVTADNTTGSLNYAKIDWADIPVSTNANMPVVKRNLYRTVAGGAEFLFMGTINDDVATTYEDTTADASLGTNTPPQLGDSIFDNSPPPSAGITVLWKRTAFLAGDPLNPNLLYYSRYDLPEAFPLANTIELDDRITGMFKTYLGLVIATETAYWRVIGDNPDYTVDQVIEGFGGVGPRGVGTARETGWVVDREGMRLYDLRETRKISEVIRDRVDAFDKSLLEDTHTAHSKANNALVWFAKDSDGTYTNRYLYQYMVDEIKKGWFSEIVMAPSDLNILHVWEIEDANGDFIFYASSDKGMVFELFSPTSLNWVNETGQSRAIEMLLQTPFMRLGANPDSKELEGTTGRVTPRLIELRIKEQSGLAHEWTVTIETSDSAAEDAVVRDTQVMTFTFPAGVSLIRIAPLDLTSAEYVRLTIQNTQKDKDLRIMGCKVFYKVRPGNYVVDGEAGGQN